MCVLSIGVPAFWRQAFKYFSTHCCAWKHVPSWFGDLRARSSRIIDVWSPSAFLTHSAVAGVIKDPASFENLANEPIAQLRAALQLGRTSHE